MNRFEQQLKKEADAMRLTHAEKATMRMRLNEAMSGTQPAAPSPLIPSPFEGYFFYSFQFVRTARYALAALLMVVFVGGGTVSAASQALPGDWLYAVKTGVNERVELAFAATAQEELRVEAQFAERRVAEAEALEAQGRLDSETAEEIELRFDEHASRALALAESIRPAASALRIAEEEPSFKQAPPEEGEGDVQPMAFMAMTAEQAEVATATDTASNKFQASVKTDMPEVEEEVDELLQRQRDRLERLRDRLDERLLEIENRKGEMKLELTASTTVEVSTPKAEAGATSTVEVSETTPSLPQSEEEAIETEEEAAGEDMFKDGTTPLERIIEKTLPIRSNLGL